MASKLFTIGCMLVIAGASPFAEPQFSLPPLIPAGVPGFPEFISSLAPPLPVLQVPTPALPSPPFVGSDIKPKKIGYFWTAAGDNKHAGMLFKDFRSFLADEVVYSDFLATYSLDDVGEFYPVSYNL